MFHSEDWKLFEIAETKYWNISHPFSHLFCPELLVELNLTAVDTCPDETAFLWNKWMLV